MIRIIGNCDNYWVKRQNCYFGIIIIKFKKDSYLVATDLEDPSIREFLVRISPGPPDVENPLLVVAVDFIPPLSSDVEDLPIVYTHI